MRQGDERLHITVADGKYTVVQSADGALRALRHDDEWRDLTGDKLVLCLAQEIEADRALLKGVVEFIDTTDCFCVSTDSGLCSGCALSARITERLGGR